MHRCLLIATLLFFTCSAGGSTLADDVETEEPPPPVKTGKERLSDKASDAQRVDDCNVPPERRGAGLRPTACARPPAAPGSADSAPSD